MKYTPLQNSHSVIILILMSLITVAPNIEVISDSLMVDRVILIEDTKHVNISILFTVSHYSYKPISTWIISVILLYLISQSPEPCNKAYPIQHYTLDIVESNITLTFDASQESTIVISSLEVPEISRGNKYTVIIGACNSITCRQSNTSFNIGKMYIKM